MTTTDTDDRYIYLTTTGRRSGRPHTIEIWYVDYQGALYMLAGGRDRSDWVRNLRADPRATVRHGPDNFPVTGRFDLRPDEEAAIRDLLRTKYQDDEDDLEEWARTALPVALDR